MRYLFIAMSILVSTTFCFSQTDLPARSFGIGGTIQTSDYGVLLPIWVSEKMTLAPAIGVNVASKIATDFAIGVVPKFYFKTESLAPYFSLKAMALINKSSTQAAASNNSTDFLLGAGFGGEYFISNNFSFFVEAQANMTKSDKYSDRFGNPGNVNFNLGTVIGAYFYFTKRSN